MAKTAVTPFAMPRPYQNFKIFNTRFSASTWVSLNFRVSLHSFVGFKETVFEILSPGTHVLKKLIFRQKHKQN